MSVPRYPHTTLAVGESFLFEGDWMDVQRLRQAVRRWGQNHGARFSVRAVEKGHRQYECRRVE